MQPGPAIGVCNSAQSTHRTQYHAERGFYYSVAIATMPRKFDGGFAGLATALRVAQASAPGNVIGTASSAGIKAQLAMYPSLAVGACAVSLLDMTVAYGTIAKAVTT